MTTTSQPQQYADVVDLGRYPINEAASQGCLRVPIDLTVPGVVEDLPAGIGRIVGFAPHVATDLLATAGVEALPRSRFFRAPREFIFTKQ